MALSQHRFLDLGAACFTAAPSGTFRACVYVCVCVCVCVEGVNEPLALGPKLALARALTALPSAGTASARREGRHYSAQALRQHSPFTTLPEHCASNALALLSACTALALPWHYYSARALR